MGWGIGKLLEPLVASGADARRIAEASAAIWEAIHTALAPVIGARGVAALYRRSLYLALANFSWLAPAYERAAIAGDYTSLRAALARQTSATAAAAHDALVQIFYDLLTGLIGGSLTHRMLQSVGDQHSDGQAVQDHSP